MESQKRKKVLIITYYWPPAGGPGVQRVLKFAKYLPEFGWDPIVLTVKDGEYSTEDVSLISDTEGIKTHKVDTLEPFQLYKRLLGKKKNHKIGTYVLAEKNQSITQNIFKWVRMNLFIPDARIGWYWKAKREGLKIIEKENIDLIYSTSPPHSLQLIAKNISKKTNIPWVADFRDPWQDIVYYQEYDRLKITKYLDSQLEKSVFSSADDIVTISDGLKNNFEKTFNLSDIHVLTNGYDSYDYDKLTSISTHKNKRIVYAGVLSKPRVPHELFRQIGLLPTKEKSEIQCIFYGAVCPEFHKSIVENKIEKCIITYGFIDHKDLTQILKNADALLMVVDNVPNNVGFLTGKLFDYLGVKKPIIAIGPKNSEVEKIISKTDSGWFSDYENSLRHKQILDELIQDKLVFKFNNSEFSRKALTKRLADIFNKNIQLDVTT